MSAASDGAIGKRVFATARDEADYWKELAEDRKAELKELQSNFEKYSKSSEAIESELENELKQLGEQYEAVQI